MAGRYVSNQEYGAANLVALVLQYREKHGEIDGRLLALAEAIDNKIATLRNELLGGAGAAFDTFKELQDLFLENKDLLEELKAIAGKHVRFDIAQALTSAEQARGRSNLGAVGFDELNAAINNAMPSAPTASVSKVGDTATITIKDRNGTTTATITDGKTGPVYQPVVDDEGNISWTNNGGLENPLPKNLRGPQGPKGDPLEFEDLSEEQIENLRGPQGVQGETGKQGSTFMPHLSSSGVLSWTNDGGLSNPQAVNIKGPQGEQGPQGKPLTYNDLTPEQIEALRGDQGEPGLPGESGVDGKDGKDGVTFIPSVSSSGVLTWTNNGGLTNPAAANLKGPKGDTGSPGATGGTGPQGVTFTPVLGADGVLSFTNDGGLQNPTPVDLTGPQGPQGVKGDTGAGLTILGEYASYDALVSAHPTGNGGDAYLVNGDVWYWAEEQNKWANAGALQGPKGTDGQAPTISFRVDENGGLYYSVDYLDNGDAEAY